MQMCAHNRSSQLRRQLKEGFLFFDGGYGTILAEAGLEPGERPELWNFRREDFIRDLHLEYLKAGCNLFSGGASPCGCLASGKSERLLCGGLRKK